MTRLTPCLLLLAACAKKPTATSSAAPVAEVEAPAEEEADWGSDLSEDEVRVTLLEAGAAPHAPLRYTPSLGDQGGLRLTIDMSIAIDMGGMQTPLDTPAMSLDMDLSVESIDPSGDITYTMEMVGYAIGESPLPEVLLAELRAQLEALVGLTGAATMTSRGEVLAQELDLAASSEQLAQFSRSSENLSLPLPAEAVGVGAQWEVLRLIDSSGVAVVDRALVTLSERAADTITLQIETVQRMADPDVSLPNLPPGAEAQVVYFQSSGSGKQVAQLSSLLPVQARSAIALEMNVVMASDGLEMSMGTEMAAQTTITRR